MELIAAGQCYAGCKNFYGTNTQLHIKLPKMYFIKHLKLHVVSIDGVICTKLLLLQSQKKRRSHKSIYSRA